MATRLSEAFWVRPHGAAWVASYAASAFRPTRAVLGSALREAAPYETALDLGCNCGVLMPWLVLDARVRVTGVDLNAEALRDAASTWPKHEWVRDSVVDWLPAQDRQWDVVTSSSCLAHVAPTDIVPTLAALARVARKAIVLQEVTTAGEMDCEGASGQMAVPEWRYDYARRLPALGWRLTAITLQLSEPTRPGAVMTFLRDR